MRRYDKASWQQSRRPDNWEARFAEGLCASFGELQEAPRFCLIAGYIHRLYARAFVLDVGCGEGHLATYLDPHRVQYVGFDPSSTAIASAKARYPGRQFHSIAVEDFEVEPDTYDVIVFNGVLPHLAAPVEVVERLRLLLRAEGKIIASFYLNSNPASNAGIFLPLFDAEVAAGRFEVLAAAEVTSQEPDLRWRVMVLS